MTCSLTRNRRKPFSAPSDDGLTEAKAIKRRFISFITFDAASISPSELMQRRPTRVAGVQEMDNGEVEMCLSGSDTRGSFFGFVEWKEFKRKPLYAAWLQRDDLTKAIDFVRRNQRGWV